MVILIPGSSKPSREDRPSHRRSLRSFKATRMTKRVRQDVHDEMGY